MAGRVEILDGTLIDQIAAGEVIERPANVVKELVENAVDAGAASIWVSIQDGGRALMSVRDDGVGMSPRDAALCIERHATSKISSFEDLLKVPTLGFRGEALPSIAAVSRLSIVTRRADDLAATRVHVAGGSVEHIGPEGSAPGTTVVVEDLFYNVPARRKFLRARQTETSKIFEICQRIALIRPQLRLEVLSEGRVARRYVPATSLEERAYQVLGDLPLEVVETARDRIAVHAVLAPRELARLGPRQLFLYVNGRPVLDRALARAVAFAYGDRLPPGHYPKGVVSLCLPAEDVDVNAHPQKTEVRFKQAARVLDRLTRMLGSALGTAGAAAHGNGPTSPGRSEVQSRSAPDVSQVSELPTRYVAPPPGTLRLVAQLRDRYLLCEADHRVLLIDRTRAQTRARYAALKRESDRGSLSTDPVLFPDRIELGEEMHSVIETHGSLLTSLGFEWSALGRGSYVIRGVPAAAGSCSARDLFACALDSLTSGPTDVIDTILNAMAAAAATPPGVPMTDESATALVDGLSRLEAIEAGLVLSELSMPDPQASEA